jgi:anti-sigma factor RsiW
MMHITDDPEALLDYLYEEGDPAERIKVVHHLHECAPCSVAVLELQSVRGLLSEWTPPSATLGFKVVQSDSAAPSIQGVPSSRGWRLGAGWPTWAQASAAMLLFVAGMGASQLRFEYGQGALTVRSGAVAPAPVTEASVAHTGTDVLLPPMFVNASDASTMPVSGGASSTRPASADEMLRRVKALIDQSESRQQRELALRLSDVVHDFDTQRQADMQRVDQNFGQLEGQTGAEVARQRELLNSLVKVSQGGSR